MNFEENPDEEFDFFLATQLKKHVGEIRALPLAEWLEWSMYYQRLYQKQQTGG